MQIGKVWRAFCFILLKHKLTWAKDDTLDTDDPEHITWLYQRALNRAKEFSITGVTYSLTQGVVKNIIPAIASTNAIIAASCCNEAFKIVTGVNPALGYPGTNNYMMYTGDDSIYTYTFEHQKKDDCPVCGNLAKPLQVDRKWTLQDFIERLRDLPEAYVYTTYSYIPCLVLTTHFRQLKNPNVRSEEKSLFYSAPADLMEQTRPNLKRKLADMVQDGEEVAVSDPAYQIDFKFKLSFRD